MTPEPPTPMALDRSGPAQLADAGYALVPAAVACATLQLDLAGLDALRQSWERLPRDAYLRDGGNYRARRHSCFVQTPAAGLLEAVPHRPHWQPTSYNALHGGLTRWFIEAHQFRIDTASGIGRPTPEGAHRDGVDFVAVILVGRRNVLGGETRVFEARGASGVRFTMQEPWSMLLMDDARVIHETTPIQPQGKDGVRDTLVLTYRAGGFQAPEAPPA